MRLAFIEACGFRGFRDRIRVDFGAGFTVITGRNGVGKSTLCDAIEFALTGSIDKYSVHKAGKESLGNYVWWRGKGSPSGYYVTLSFRDDEGQEFAITRSREGGANRPRDEIEAQLCIGLAPDDALRQLCKTFIIRDEWIAALSLDLTETDRFDLVRSALGPVGTSDYGVKARDVIASAQAAHARNEELYRLARDQLNRSLTQLSEAQDLVARSGDIAAAMAAVAAVTPNEPSDLVALLTAGRAALVARRKRLAAAQGAVSEGREVIALRRSFDQPEATARRDAAYQLLETSAMSKGLVEKDVAQARREVEREEEADKVAASLAALVEHGTKLGLHDQHCPLCAAPRSSTEFQAGLSLARARMESLASGVGAARQRLATAMEAFDSVARKHAEAAAAWSLIEQEKARLVAREQAYVNLFAECGLDSQFLGDPDALERNCVSERDSLVDLERAILTLEASQTVSRIAILEDEIVALRKSVEEAADLTARSETAVTFAHAIERGIRRVNGEVIDERLAKISPLLNELYQRLRPHVDWRTIDYSVRGDVRRFLSLTVGNGLNPQFVFSSGQRRAAGLAFLLSVHLARQWARLRTLVLDDPVQHIDDFRALNLVEMLAAFRLDGRQIVCAVEDAALADLLCRRLLSTSGGLGRRYDIDLDSQGVPMIRGEAEIPPMPAYVLRGDGG